MVWDPEEVYHSHLVALLDGGQGKVTYYWCMVRLRLHVKDGLVIHARCVLCKCVIRMCTCTCVCICVCVCVHVYMCICVCVCVHVYMCVYMCMCTCARVHVHVHMCMCTCVCVHVHVHMCMCTCVCVHVYVYVCAYVQMTSVRIDVWEGHQMGRHCSLPLLSLVDLYPVLVLINVPQNNLEGGGGGGMERGKPHANRLNRKPRDFPPYPHLPINTSTNNLIWV